MWKFFQDMPMPEGTAHTRMPFDQFMKYHNRFEEKLYGIEIVAVDGEKYVQVGRSACFWGVVLSQDAFFQS